MPACRICYLYERSRNGNVANGCGTWALQRYLALPVSGPQTIAAWKAYKATLTDEHSDPRNLEYWDQLIEGLRKAGMPEA